MRLSCIIVEDQPPAQRILKKFIDETVNLELSATFSDGLAAMDFLKNNDVDVMFLDIHLPKITGLDFLKSLQNPPHVILTTAFSEYALEGYELNVVDYLLKPFSFQRFLQAVNKIKHPSKHPSSQDDDSKQEEFYVKSGHEYIKVKSDEIVFIKADSDYTELHLHDKKVLSNDSLRHWLDHLNTSNFIQLHKSYIVNTEKIERVSATQVFVLGGTAIPVGRAYKNNFMQRLLS